MNTLSKVSNDSPRETRALLVYDATDRATQSLGAELARDSGFDVDIIEPLKPSGWKLPLPHAIDKMVGPGPQFTWTKDPAEYDLVVVGTPVVHGTASAGVRTYLEENAERLRRVAFFCTAHKRGGWHTLREMSALTGRVPAAMLLTTATDIEWRRHCNDAWRFLETLLDALAPAPLVPSGRVATKVAA